MWNLFSKGTSYFYVCINACVLKLSKPYSTAKNAAAYLNAGIDSHKASEH